MSGKFQRRIDDLWNSPILFSLVFTLFICIVFMYTSPQLSGAGDKNISEFLSSSGKIKEGFFFISPIVAIILRTLNHFFLANWWSIFSVFIMFIGQYTFLWIINKRLIKYDWTIRMLASGLFVLFFWELLLKYEINFTQTAVIASLTGFCLIADLCFSPSINKKDSIRIIVGIVLLLLGGGIRWDALILTLPFEIMVLAYMFLFPYSADNIFKSVKKSIKNKKHILILLFITVITFAGSYALHKLYSVYNPKIGEYLEANELRANISDYTGRYPSYDDNKDVYEQLGIKSSWINMVYSFMTSDVNYFSAEDLQKMVDLRGKTDKTVKEFIDTLQKHTILWLSLLSIFIGIFILKGWKNSFLPLMGCIFAYVLFALYFVKIGRFEWRATNGCILAGVISFIVMSFHPVSAGKSFGMNRPIKIGVFVLIALLSIIGVVMVKREKTFSMPMAKAYDQERADVLNYINKNKEIVYLYVDIFRFVDTYNLWSTHSTDYLDNYFPLAAHFIMGCSDKLEEYGINDLYSDLIDRADVYITYSNKLTPIFTDYLRDYYDPFVSISVVDEFNGFYFLRYSKQIIPEKRYDEENDIKCNVSLINMFDEDETIYQTFNVDCNVDNKVISNYKDFYINVNDLETSNIYSYGMAIKGNNVSAEILCMNNTWDPASVEVNLVGRTYSDEIVQLANLTDEFYLNYQ